MESLLESLILKVLTIFNLVLAVVAVFWFVWKRLTEGRGRDERQPIVSRSASLVGEVDRTQGGIAGIVTETPRSIMGSNASPVVKQENGQDVRASPFRFITPQRQHFMPDDTPTPRFSDMSSVRGSNVRQPDGQRPQSDMGDNAGQNHPRDQQAVDRDVRLELTTRGGKVAARKPEVFNEQMNIDEWLESLKAYLAGTNPNASSEFVLISQVKSFLSSTALKRVKHIFRMDVC